MNLETLSAIQPYLEKANVVDKKSIEAEGVTLRQFLAGSLSYHPAWLDFLYRVRAVLVTVLRISKTGIPPQPTLTPETISFEVGRHLSFFKTYAAQEDSWWVGGASESHLTAYLAVVAEPLSATRTRFHVITSVYYHARTGVFYFNLIRPFHHLVVRCMMQSGVRRYQAA
jgi:hypothetical protein